MKTIKKKVLAFICFLAVTLTACGRTEIAVNDYFSAKTEGANGNATIGGELNTLAMVQENRKAFDLSDTASESELRGIADTINSNIDGQFDRDAALSNGDTVIFKWDISTIETIESIYKHAKFVTEDKTMTVSGLQEIHSFDPFDYLTVNFVRYSTNAEGIVSMTMDISSKIPYRVNFARSDVSDLHCGDTFRIEVVKVSNGKEYSQQEIEEDLAKHGYEISAYEKEYTVPDSMDEITAVD